VKHYQEDVLEVSPDTIDRLEQLLDGERDVFLAQDEEIQEKSFHLWCNYILAENVLAQQQASDAAAEIDQTWKVLAI